MNMFTGYLIARKTLVLLPVGDHAEQVMNSLNKTNKVKGGK